MLGLYRSMFLSFDKNFHITIRLKVVRETSSVLKIARQVISSLSAEKAFGGISSIELGWHCSLSDYPKFPDLTDVVMPLLNALLFRLNYFTPLATQTNVYKTKNLAKSVELKRIFA